MDELSDAYGDHASSDTHVENCVADFKHGQVSLEDEHTLAGLRDLFESPRHLV